MRYGVTVKFLDRRYIAALTYPLAALCEMGRVVVNQMRRSHESDNPSYHPAHERDQLAYKVQMAPLVSFFSTY